MNARKKKRKKNSRMARKLCDPILRKTLMPSMAGPSYSKKMHHKRQKVRVDRTFRYKQKRRKIKLISIFGSSSSFNMMFSIIIIGVYHYHFLVIISLDVVRNGPKLEIINRQVLVFSFLSSLGMCALFC